MILPPGLRAFLPADTAAAWEAIAPVVPRTAYLVGGTAITARLLHRVSQDLDFFLDEAVDLDELSGALDDAGPFAVTLRAPGTLNAVFSATKVQFLDATAQHAVDADGRVGGLRVASLRDLAAMKLKVIGDRGELRDYFDLMVLDQQGVGVVEVGLVDFVRRFQPEHVASALQHVVLALGFLDDVDEDDLIPCSREEVSAYWRRRQPSIVRATGRLG